MSFDVLFEYAENNLKKAEDDSEKDFCITYNIENKSVKNNKTMPARMSYVPVNFLIENINEGIRLLEMSEPVKQIYISPNFFKNSNINSDISNKILIHPYDSWKYNSMLQTAIESGSPAEEEYRISVDGKKWFWRHARAVKIPYSQNEYPIILEISSDISNIREKELFIAESEEMIKVAFKNTTRVIWEVDIENKVYKFINLENKFEINDLKDFPESLISGGWVHPDSAEDYRKFGFDILNGKSRGNGSFILRHRDSESYGWASLSYNLIFDQSGYPVKAIGVKNFLSDISERKNGFINMSSLPDAVHPSMILNVRANLTDNSINDLWAEGSDSTDFAGIKKYSDIVENEKSKMFSKDDNKEYSEKLGYDSLLKVSDFDVVWRSMQYRRIDSFGNIRWVLNTVNLIKDRDFNKVYLSSYINDIEKRHKWERGININIDPETGLYNRETAETIIKNVLGSEKSCAVSLIQINGFSKMVNDKYGSMGQKQYYISTALVFALGTDCIVGRYDNDMLVACFVNIPSRSIVKKRLEDAFSYIRSTMAHTKIMRSLRFIAGTVCIQKPIVSYENIMSKALYTCVFWKNSSSDVAAFLDENENLSWKNFDSYDDNACVTFENNLTDTLSEDEKNVALSCLESIIVSDSIDLAVKGVLKNIGKYYNADRVYILSLAENNHVITMLYEWISNEKWSIQRAISGMRIDKFPLLCRCMEEKKPVFMSNADIRNYNTNKGDTWNFIALPIINKENNQTIENGFFCIENPKNKINRADLPLALIPYIFKITSRSGMNETSCGSELDVLTNLPNLRSYTDVIDSVNSDIYSSLGALALDIPDLPAINSTQGFEYGSKLILHVSEILSEIFGKSYLFRTWDSEFVALCPNTTFDAFMERCDRVRSILQQSYHKQIRIGYTWSDGIFYAKKLVKEAKSIMRCEFVKVIPPADAISVWGMRYTDFSSAAENGRFTVYFQPKIDMTTETLFGAEALIRGIDDDGKIIPPVKFIESMENNGTIRDLDFFVLDKTLSQMEDWYEKGFDPISISVNISRRTLLDPTAPASMLAIQSRYSDTLSGMIELEITESGCDIEKGTLSHVMDNFRKFGMKFSLDDFGSHYSNISIFTNVKFETIKIDRSLINELAENEADRSIIRNIIGICKKNGMTCIAEGVETSAQVRELLNIGCSVCQGYYYDKALSAEDFEKKWLENIMEEI